MASKMMPLIEGKRIILRDYLPSDLGRFIHWQTHGQWRHLDAPWEGVCKTLSSDKEEDIRAKFLAHCQDEKTTPRSRAIIVRKADLHPLGWVNTYGQVRFSGIVYGGISICEDEAINRGLGTETLKLWINYLFTHGNFHKIALETWSFNPRMMRVAEKAGFKLEGAGREMIQWEGTWLDMMHYGLLRREWETIKSEW